MYQIYFKNRAISLSDNIEKYSQQKYSILYKYNDPSGLSEVIDSFVEAEKKLTLFVYHFNINELWDRFRDYFMIIKAGGGLIRNRSGEFIAIKRSGKWDLPKGKKDKGESIENCALREVSEECGIKKPEIRKTLCSTYHIYFIGGKPVLKDTTWFEMIYNGTEKLKPQIEEKITEVRWFAQDEIRVIFENTYLSVRDVLERAGIGK